MSLSINDLRVEVYGQKHDQRAASLADLVEVLLSEGAVEIEVASRFYEFGERGTYLVYRLKDGDT